MCRRGVPSHVAYLHYLGGAVISGGGDKGSNGMTHEKGLPLSGFPLVSLIPSFHPTTVDHICCGPHPSGEGRGTEWAVQAKMWCRVASIINQTQLLMD